MAGKKTEKSNPPARCGKPRKFATDEDYAQAFVRYIEHCRDKGDMPNIAGFCVFNDMHRDTFYAQQALYPDTHKKIQSALEDRAINYRSNPAMSIFYLKNKFGYSDKGNSSDDLSGSIMVDFDAGEAELDNLMLKLGYLPKPEG